MRFFTLDQLALIRSSGFRANMLITLRLDEGWVRLCDSVDDITLGDGPSAITWIGASVLLDSTEIKASSPLTAESVTITLDGNRLYEAGVTDPGFIMNSFLNTKYTQRRVDFAYAIFPMDSTEASILFRAYSGKINYAKLVHSQMDEDSADGGYAKLEIYLDALASRYRRATYRTRSAEDQNEIYGGDKFYNLVTAAAQQEQSLWWGRKAPTGTTSNTIDTSVGGGKFDSGSYDVLS